MSQQTTELQLRVAQAVFEVEPRRTWRRKAVDNALLAAHRDGLLCAPPVWVSPSDVEVHLAGSVRSITLTGALSL
jgi:hypothetical protein